MERLGIFSIKYNPNLLNGIAPQRDYPYGQVGTLLRCEIVFATSVPVGAVTFKYGWVKNSTVILQPTTTNSLEAFKILDSYFKNLNTEGGQAWNGTDGALNYMNPLSGKDGTATLESSTITAETWNNLKIYQKNELVNIGVFTYISNNDNNINNNPLSTPDWWTLASVYKLTQTLRIQPLAKLSDFDGNGVYLKSSYLQNFESVKNVYEINAKETPASPVNVASSSGTDPKISSGTIGFLDEKLNGLPLDVLLSDLTINGNSKNITEVEENIISFIVESSEYVLSESNSTINVIAHDLEVPENLNTPYLDLINFSSAVKGFPDSYIKDISIAEISVGILKIGIKVSELSSDRAVLIYANITSDNTRESEQSLLLFYGLPEALPEPPVFDTIKTVGANIEGFEFAPEYATLSDSFQNISAFSEDIIVSRFSFYRVDKNATALSIDIQLINDDSEVLTSESFEVLDLPVSQETNFNINSTERKNITLNYSSLEDSYTIIYPFKIIQDWANRTAVRLKISVNYDLNDILDVSTFESAIFSLGSYDETKNTKLEPQVLPLNQKSIEILSEDGTTALNQLNKDTNSRIRVDFEDKNAVTDDLQAEEADLVGYIGISKANSVQDNYIIHSIFGAEPVTPFISIDGSINPECKITKLDTKTARVEAVVDTAKLVDILGENTNYQIICRLDKIEIAKLSVDQTTFIFNYNSIQKYNYTLDADLLISAYLTLYYSSDYPTVLTFTHVASATSLTDFSVFSAYVNSNASSGDVITIENTIQSEEGNSIVMLNVPKSPAVPALVANTSTLPANSVEHDNIFAFNNKIEVDSVSIGGITEEDIYYAFRTKNSELVTFEKYNKSEINGLINNLATGEEYLLHLWGARSGGSESITINYKILEGNEILSKSNVFSENLNELRALWSRNSLKFISKQFVQVGNLTKPYNQINIKDSYTFYFVFYQDAVTSGAQTLLTTGLLDYDGRENYMTLESSSKYFRLRFVYYYDTTPGAELARDYVYRGIGVKAGYNFVIGYWDYQNPSNRHIFINGNLQSGEVINNDGFDLENDSILNPYNSAAIGAKNINEITPSGQFNGHVLDMRLNTELFTNREAVYYDAFRKGVKNFDDSKNLLSVDFNKTNGVLPEVLDSSGVNYPIVTNNSTEYTDFNTL